MIAWLVVLASSLGVLILLIRTLRKVETPPPPKSPSEPEKIRTYRLERFTDGRWVDIGPCEQYPTPKEPGIYRTIQTEELGWPWIVN